MFSAAAVMTIRDEAVHMPYAVEHLISEGIEVVVLDDGSRDHSVDLLAELRGNGLLAIYHRPRRRHMALRDLLKWERSVIKELRHDWVMHVDADEWLHTEHIDLSLRDFLHEADSSGATVVNFEEFVFTPIDDIPKDADPRCRMLEYYFFAPSKLRLMRAWRRDANLDNTQLAGHRLQGDGLRVFPVNGVLRHYPMVTPDHGVQKYSSRSYDKTELERGWHSNRLPLLGLDGINRPTGARLRKLDRWDSRNLDRSAPCKYHFWEELWDQEV